MQETDENTLLEDLAQANHVGSADNNHFDNNTMVAQPDENECDAKTDDSVVQPDDKIENSDDKNDDSLVQPDETVDKIEQLDDKMDELVDKIDGSDDKIDGSDDKIDESDDKIDESDDKVEEYDDKDPDYEEIARDKDVPEDEPMIVEEVKAPREPTEEERNGLVRCEVGHFLNIFSLNHGLVKKICKCFGNA